MRDIVYEHVLYEPFQRNATSTFQHEESHYPQLVCLTVEIPQEGSCLVKQEGNILHLQAKSTTIQSIPSFFNPLSRDEGAVFRAIASSDSSDFYSANLFILVTATCPDEVDRKYVAEVPCYDNVWDQYQSLTEVEEVQVVDNLLNNELEDSFNKQVDTLARHQESEGLVDYHPHSNRTVRDLTHPSMYPTSMALPS